jgi:hypothetical protein
LKDTIPKGFALRISPIVQSGNKAETCCCFVSALLPLFHTIADQEATEWQHVSALFPLYFHLINSLFIITRIECKEYKETLRNWKLRRQEIVVFKPWIAD